MTLQEAIETAEQRANLITFQKEKTCLEWYVFKFGDGFCFFTEYETKRKGLTEWVYNTIDKEIRADKIQKWL